MTVHWTALILAGQRPGIDPLAAHFGTEWKALVPVAGEAMLTHVIRTLRQCPEIKRIVVIAQDPDTMTEAVSAAGGADAIRKSRNSISNSIADIIGSDDAPWPILVTTADHPLLTTAMVGQFLGEAKGADVAVGMVERRAMLARFPDAKRTWLKFKNGAWSGANLFALSGEPTRNALALWANAEQDRKHAFKLFWHFGPVLALRAISRTITMRDALVLGGKRIGVDARLVPMADPCAAIDVDKLSDHQLVERIFKERKLE